MRIQDLTEDYRSTYCICFEEWSDEMKEAGNHKSQWLDKMKENGLGAKIAVDDDGTAIGLIQYLPIEYSTAQGENLYFIDCIWVHGYKKGIGNQQGQGVGVRLLEAAEEDARARGAKGMAAWGLSIPVWMKASYFKKNGYKKVERDSMRTLLWKPFTDDALPPKWVNQKKTPRSNENPGKVTIYVFYDGRCPTQNIILERTKRAAALFEEKVVLKVINTFDREVYNEWGLSDGLYIEGKHMNQGPPLTYESICKAIKKRVSKLS